MDTQGRVIRLESFSKTLFPGLRMGYFVANPVFTERLLRATEVETQDPAGLSQALVLSLLRRWGIDGYLVWLQSLQFQYRERRDWLLDAFHARFVVLPAAKSPVPQAQGLVACVRAQQGGELRPVFSFVDPGAGMFVWSSILTVLANSWTWKSQAPAKIPSRTSQTSCGKRGLLSSCCLPRDPTTMPGKGRTR